MTGKLEITLEADEIVLLFVPNIAQGGHYHIHLTPMGAEQLFSALDKFLINEREGDSYDVPIDKVM